METSSSELQACSVAEWHSPKIPAPGKLREENFKFDAILDYIAEPCIKINK